MTDTFWLNHMVGAGTSWVLLLTLFIFTVFHCFRLYHASDTDDNHTTSRRFSKTASCISLKVQICKLGNTKRTSYIIIASTMLSVINQIIIHTQFHRHYWFTINLCKHTILFAVIAKLTLHLFVAIRTQIHRNTVKSIYLNLSYIMTLSDILLIIFIVSGLAPINVHKYNQQFSCVPHGPLFVYIWYAINDFIIGLYCLLVFVLPLLDIIHLEKQDPNDFNNHQPTVTSVVIKIVIYTSIALISTLATTMLSCLVKRATGTAMAFDLVLNCICVILQFGNIDINLVPKGFRCMANLLQCGAGCFVSNKRTAPAVPPPIIILPTSTASNTKNSKISALYTNSSTVNDASHNSVATIHWTQRSPFSHYSPFDSVDVPAALKLKSRLSSNLTLEWRQSSEPTIGTTRKKTPILKSTRSDPMHPK